MIVFPGGIVNLRAVYRSIDEMAEKYVEDLRGLIRLPSISTEAGGTRQCGERLRCMMEQLGIETRLLETHWQPYVFGQMKSRGSDKTLLVYNHYDVVSADPLQEWICDPFAAELRDGKIIGRGATDSKGNLMAHLAAVESFVRVAQDVPINLKFLFDGEEEIGCVSMPALLREHRELLHADAVLSFDSGFTDGDAPTITFGNGGILYLEVTARGGRKILHSSRGGNLVPNPLWDLVWALATLKGPDQRIRIERFYENVRPVTSADEALMQDMPWDDARQREAFGVEEFLRDLSGVEAVRAMFFEPKCTLCGITGGYAGEGVKTVLPNVASAKIHFSLTADQLPDEILDKLRAHLQRQGCENLELRTLSATEPSVCSPDSEIGKATRRAAEQVYGAKSVVLPRLYGYGRQATWIANRLGVQGVMTGIGPPDFNGHAPNEFITLSHFIRGIKYAATIWAYFGQGDTPTSID